jgi:hypothetical protein
MALESCCITGVNCVGAASTYVLAVPKASAGGIAESNCGATQCSRSHEHLLNELDAIGWKKSKNEGAGGRRVRRAG